MNRILRIIGGLVALIIIVLVILVGYIFISSDNKMNTVYQVEALSLDIPTDESSLVEGERIFLSRRCGDCHGIDGGGDPTMADDPAFGTFGSANLTSGEGGLGQTYVAEDFIRSIQHGVDAEGRPLFIMPSNDWQQMPEAELASLIAYILSLEPVDREIPEPQPGFIARVGVAFGIFPFAAEEIDHDAAGLLDVEAAATVEYGTFLALVCNDCHTDNYGGGPIFDVANTIALNISSHEDGIGNWSLEEFSRAVRSAVRPDGSVIAAAMPWQWYTHLTDVEVEAIYLFLQSTEPVAGN